MSGKNQFPITFNWQSTDPSVGFNPVPAINGGGSAPSGVKAGTMTGTSVIYSNIIEISRMDNVNLEVNWSGSPTGTFQVKTSNLGNQFSALTFSPSLAQPSGTAGFYTIDLNQLGCKYLMLQYTNATGTGFLGVYGQQKDLN